MKNSVFYFLAISLFFCYSCDNYSDDEDQQNSNYAIALTESARFPVVINHEEGEHIIVEVDPSTEQVVGAVYLNEGAEALVKFSDNGLPSQGFLNNHTFIFSNYSGNTLDIGIIDGQGTSQIIRDVVLDGYDFDTFGRPNDLKTQLQAAGLGLSVMNCAIGVGLALGSGGIAIPVAALGCSSALLTIIATIDSDDNGLDTSASVLSTYANTIGCVTGNPSDCLAYVVDIATFLNDASATHGNEFGNEITLTQAALLYGYGDIQVTLTWDSTADIDLYVTDPFGETISYQNETSASGGALDVDDIDGYGPENIYWLTGTAPSGTYNIEVDHYSGTSPTRFQVRVDVLGESAIFNGIIEADQNILITNFTVQNTVPKFMEKMIVGISKENRKIK